MDQLYDYEGKQPKKPVRHLEKSLRSLLGLKAHLTPSWVESVCQIIQDLPTAKLVRDSRMENPMFEEMKAIDHNSADEDSSALKIQGDLASLNSRLNKLNIKRRQALNDLLDLKGNIRVFCRIRPFLQDERYRYMTSVATFNSSKVFLKFAENKSKLYSFDKVFHPESTQEEVFSEIEPVIKSALDGYNVCIFAYGQTGTGKTYTMEGKHECPGVVPRGIKALFDQTLESNYKYLFSFSMLEIYMGSLRDLLVSQRKMGRVQKAPCLSIQTDPNGGIEIENLVSVQVSDFEQVRKLYKLGSRLRSTASTNSNSKSSRSHCLIRITITCPSPNDRRRETNKIWMVDLGGSERLLKTKASGRRLDEGKAINLSLSALGDVISALQNRKPHVPYRNSKLTQVLRDSVGSDSKTLMLVHISPAEEDLCETVCSLGFATRVRSIHLGNEESEEAKVKKEVSMGELLQRVKHIESENQTVRQEIKRLNEKLNYLVKPKLQSDGQKEASYPSIEGPRCHWVDNVHNVTGPAETSATLPRFMRPTICSRRKTTVDHCKPLMAHKKPPLPSKRKSSSVYADSVTSAAKGILWQSDHGSDYSISTSNDLNSNYSGEDESNCSRSILGYEIKKVIVPEKENSLRSMMTTTSIESVNETDGGRVGDYNQKKHFPIDKWLDFQGREQTPIYSKGNKRVLAIPTDVTITRDSEKNPESAPGQEESLLGFNTKNSSTDYLKEKISKELNHYEADQHFGEVMIVEKSIANAIADETLHLSVGSTSDIASRKYDQDREPDETVVIKFIPGYHRDELSTNTTNIKVGSVPALEPAEIVFEESKLSAKSYTGDFNQPKQCTKDIEEPCLCFNARRSLFTGKDPLALDRKKMAKEEVMTPASNFPEESIGAHELYQQTVQMLWACVLLLFGIRSLGLGHDFYHGLMH